jgi:5-methylcytosine-specific restriction endonuclease McrA
MPKKIDLIGRTFGKLTVLREVDPIVCDWRGRGKPSIREKKGRIGGPRWECRCDCGIVLIKSSHQLKTRNLPACSNCMKQPRRLRPFEYLYNQVLYRRKDNIPVDLTYEDFLTFTNTTACHYCASPIIWLPFSTQKSSTGYHLDRKDSALGYTVENCTVCCSCCNLSKGGRFTYEEWLQIGRVIKAIRRPRSYEETKKTMLERDEWKCRNCSSRSNLTPHHVIHRSQGGDNSLLNLVTLCFKCHSDHHEGRLSVERFNGDFQFRRIR